MSDTELGSKLVLTKQMDALLYEHIRLIERNESEVSPVWRGGHILLFFLAFVFGAICTFGFHTLMNMFDGHCVLYPRIVPLSSMRNPAYEFLPADESPDLPVQYVSPKWKEKSVCHLPAYVPMLSALFGLLWTAFMMMCSTGNQRHSGLQRQWRILPPVIVFSAAMSVLCIYSSVHTQRGLEVLCLEMSTIAGTESCSYTVNVASLVYSGRARGVYQAMQLTVFAAWLHSACWALSAGFALLRLLLAADFQLAHVRIHLRGQLDRMMELQEQHIRTISPTSGKEDDPELVEAYYRNPHFPAQAASLTSPTSSPALGKTTKPSETHVDVEVEVKERDTLQLRKKTSPAVKEKQKTDDTESEGHSDKELQEIPMNPEVADTRRMVQRDQSVMAVASDFHQIVELNAAEKLRAALAESSRARRRTVKQLKVLAKTKIESIGSTPDYDPMEGTSKDFAQPHSNMNKATIQPSEETSGVQDTASVTSSVHYTARKIPVVQDTASKTPALQKTASETSTVQDTARKIPAVQDTPSKSSAVQDTASKTPDVKDTASKTEVDKEKPVTLVGVDDKDKTNAGDTPIAPETASKTRSVEETASITPTVKVTVRKTSGVKHTTRKTGMVQATVKKTPTVKDLASKTPIAKDAASKIPTVKGTARKISAVKGTASKSHAGKATGRKISAVKTTASKITEDNKEQPVTQVGVDDKDESEEEDIEKKTSNEKTEESDKEGDADGGSKSTGASHAQRKPKEKQD